MKARLLLAALLASSLTALAQAPQITWQPVDDNVAGAPRVDGLNNYVSLYLPSASSVWVANRSVPTRGISYATLHHSTDDGQTWESVNLGFATSAGGTAFWDLYVLNDQAAWVVMLDNITRQRQLTRSSTGTSGFQAVTTPMPTALTSVAFFNSTTGVAIGTSAAGVLELQRTTDGGVTWNPVALPPPSGSGTEGLTKRVVMGTTIWLSTDRGYVLRSVDSGATWTRAATGLATSGGSIIRTQSGVAFRDALHGLAYLGYVVARNGTQTGYVLVGQMASTTDGGLTWTPVALTGTPRFGVVEAVSGTNIYLSGSDFYVGLDGGGMGQPVYEQGLAVSLDEGRTWQTLDPTIRYAQLALASSSRMWATSSFGGNGFIWSQVFKASSLTLAARPVQLRGDAAVYPNPTAGIVQLPAGHAYREARLYDPAGRLCRTLHLAPGSAQLDLGRVPDGLYQLELRTATGAAVSQRLAVQH